ncbi:MAG: oligosaccharide flippase family protein [Bacteroidetes bacterium]|nr:oligosaccharide flippase family protein [Bacteroidota bacterium]
MEIKTRALRGFAWNHIAKVFDYVLAYLFSILLARKLGALQFGVYATVISITTLLLHLSSLGFDTLLTKYTAQLLSNHGGSMIHRFIIRRLLSGRVLIILLLCISLLALKNPLSLLFRNEMLSIYLTIIVFYVFFQSLVLFNVNLLLGALKTKTIFLISVSARAVNLATAYILLTHGCEIKEILILITAVSFCTVVFYFSKTLSYFSGPSTKSDVKPMLKFGLTVWVISILTFILGKQSDILLLNYFLGSSTEVGYYEVAFSFTQAIGYSFVIGLTGVSLATFSELAVTDTQKLAKSWELILKGMQLVLIPVLLYFIVYAGEIIPIIYTSSFNNSVILFRLFATLMLMSWIIGGGLNMTVLYSMGLQKSVLLSRSLSGLMNIVLNILFIPKLQAMGAIIATGCSTILAISIELFWVRSRIDVRFPFNFLLKIVVISLFSLSLTFLYDVSHVKTLLISGLQYFFLFILLVYIFKIINLKKLFQYIFKSGQ